MVAEHLPVRAGALEAQSARLAVCTIVAKNHLPRARVLHDSLRRYHPEIPFIVLLADKWNGEFDPSAEPFPILWLQDLNIPNFDKFCFQYTLFELTCAAKPFLLEYLAVNLGIPRLVYFDSDILILGNLDPLLAQLDNYSILLTPHLTEPPADDGKTPGEIDMLQVGIFNGGFVGVKYDATGRAFVNWWRERLYEQSRVDLARGLFVDQKWLNLVPGLFERVGILRDPGYNIAYWNLSTRKLEFKQGATCVNGQPGYFFHFSGFDLATPNIVSRHESRFTMETIGPAAALYRKYAERVAEAGDMEASTWQYAYGMFDNGVPIPEAARTLYIELDKKGTRFHDPFGTREPSSFYAWLNAPHEQDTASAQPISNLWYGIYKEMPAIQAVFPDVFGADRQAYLQWVVDYGARERRIPARFVATALKAINIARRRTRVTSAQGLKGKLPFGVNLLGNFRSEKGVGEAVRGGRANLVAAQVPNVANDFQDVLSLNQDMSVSDLTEQRPYRFNLVWLNADTIPLLLERRGATFPDGYYNIAHWAWEVQDFPSQWATSFDPFDEIWVASTFIEQGLARVSPVPVRAVPYSILPPDDSKPGALMGFPRDQFVFLYMFDMASYAARKNPRGVIRAFQKAFRRDDKAMLVLKLGHSNTDPAGLREMQEAARDSNILITDAVLGRAQINALLDASDCYVSLHRAEGFGLTMAEAMVRGKPVIATGYSGNLDFMNAANSYLVDYRLTAIGQTHGPYHKDFCWAEPDIEHAAAQMRHVFENREAARAVGAKARQDVLAQLHPRVVGELMKNYLSQVR